MKDEIKKKKVTQKESPKLFNIKEICTFAQCSDKRGRKWKLTLHFQVSRALGVGGSKRHLARLRDFAVVQDQSVFGSVLHDLNVLRMARQTLALQ